jgi:tRNA pseudouridine38-40 synthase
MSYKARINVVATVAYDGTAFSGFQLQKDVSTVQGSLERALQTLYSDRVAVHCSGRTDSGVHATGQVVSFKVPELKDALIVSLNALTPDELAIVKLAPAPDSFHPRYSCIAREYEYLISASTAWHPMLRNRVWHRRSAPGCEEFQSMLPVLKGELDFGAFTRPQYLSEGTRRYLDLVELREVCDSLSGELLLSFCVRGNAFLHNMIRIMIGTLMMLAEDLPEDERAGALQEILKSRDRTRAGRTAPPQGLYFRHAYYPDEPGIRQCGLRALKDFPRFRDIPAFE